MLLGVDVGGTFTDAVLVGEDSAVFSAKVASTPDEQSVGVLAAVRLVLERAGARAGDVELFAHGMTVATNALLEGHAARTALIATEGFTDVLELARQARPSAPAPRASSARSSRTPPRGSCEKSPARGPKPWPWRCCTPTPSPSTSACWPS